MIKAFPIWQGLWYHDHLTCDEEEFENDCKMCLGLSMEEQGRGPPVFAQAVDGQTEEDNVCGLQDKNNGVEVEKLRREEKISPATWAKSPLSVPSGPEEAVGVTHAG